MPDRAEQAGGQPGSEEHEDGDPVRVRRQHDGAEQRQAEDDEHAAGELHARPEDPVGPPVAGETGDREAREVDAEDVGDADETGAEEAREEQRRAPDRTHHERLQQPALRVARDDAHRQEHREHDAEEERREHRQAHQERARERARVDGHVGRGRDAREVAEHEVVRNPEQEQEERRQHEDDEEDLPPNGLAEAVPGNDGDRAQSVSPPTASR